MSSTWKISHVGCCKRSAGYDRWEKYATEAEAIKVFHDCGPGCKLEEVPDPAITALHAQFELQKFYRRERIAIACLQGLLSSGEGHADFTGDEEADKFRKMFAEVSVAYADALIRALGDPFP